MADEITFNAHSLETLARDMRIGAERVRLETQAETLVIGKEIAEAAKVIAGQHSKSVPPTIRVRPLPGAAVIEAGNESTPIAVLDELGNKGSKRTAKTFRHPVFGQNVFVDQPKHPYLAPALTASRREITKRMESVWARALESARLRPE